MAKHKYPIGIQTFDKIRSDNFLYIDKTELIYNLAHGNSQYVFLGRPRRFGKSLLASTMHCYFEGRKDLFKGLAIENLEKEWKNHPVLHFDMSKAKHLNEQELEYYLCLQVEEYERKYCCEDNVIGSGNRFARLMKHTYEQTGSQVVVIIDEYDAPLLDVAHEGDRLKNLRHIMRNFYSPLKASDPYLRFVFFTGITKFSQLSIFSELNNITNVSMWDKYAGICGITKEELLTAMSEDIDMFAEHNSLTCEEAVKELTENYDGYHFSPKSPDIFNPYSLLNCFERTETGSYWFASGTPTYLIEMMRKYKTLPSEIGGICKATADNFDVPVETMRSIMPLLYQSGYMTIKGYSPLSKIYTLSIPNKEVRTGLMKALIPNYINAELPTTVIGELAEMFLEGNIEGALCLLQKFFKTVPYCNDIDHEGQLSCEPSAEPSLLELCRGEADNGRSQWQQMLYVVFSLFGAYGDVEVHTSDGRVDLVMVLWGKLYLIETKLDKSADEAMHQIDLKDYAERFSLLNLPTVKIGINFSTKERGITDWKVEDN